MSPLTPYVIADDQSSVRKSLLDLAHYARSLEQQIASLRSSNMSLDADQSSRGSPPPPDASDIHPSEDTHGISEALKRLTVSESGHDRFFGHSSTILLVKTAMDIKKGSESISATEQRLLECKRPEFWSISPVSRKHLSFLVANTFSSGSLLRQK